MKIFRNSLFLLILALFLIGFIFASCDSSESDDNNNDTGNNEDPTDPGDIPTGLLSESDFQYLGAFRLPNGTSETATWDWGGHSMTYYPDGDSGGPSDGYPGSLIASGHAWAHLVSEVSIPVPVISQGKNVGELNTAGTIQGFTDLLDVSDLEIPRTALCYLPRQGNQNSAKLYLAWGYHMQEDPPDLTHGWCDLNFGNPNIKRGWYLAGLPTHIRNMSTNDYMFEIPESWANEYTPGKRLATGRFRDGGWSGQGPALFAIGPWNDGNPPADGAAIANTKLLLYTSTYDQEGGNIMNNYHHSDEWTGAEWLTTDDKAAVVFVGTKGLGDCWYGNENGPCLECENRGWWSSQFEAQIIFYDPSDLAAVASGQMQPHEPQPYHIMRIDSRLFNVTSNQQKHHVAACAFDRENGLFYVLEYRADGDKPLVHIWKIGN